MLELVIAAGMNSEPLEEIIVTGNRVGQSREEVAASVSTLTGDQLRLTPNTTIDTLLNQAPGVMLQSTNGQQHLTSIRSPVLTAGAGQGSFLYLENGLALRAAAFGNVNGLLESTWELADGIEVWRGPGTAVYGANAVHGLVNVIHNQPDSALVSFAASEFGQQARIEAPVGRGFVKGYVNRDDGWRDSTGVDQEKLFISVPISLNDFEFTNEFAVHRLDQQTAGFIFGADAFKDESLITTNPNPDAYRIVDGWRWKGEISFNDGALRLNPYYRSLDSELLMHFLPSQAIEKASQSSVGILSSYQFELDNMVVQVGADIDSTDGQLFEEQVIPDVFSYTQGVHYDYGVNTLQTAAYTQATGQFTERLSWNAGLRYEHMRYDYQNRLPTGTEGRFLRPESGTDRFDIWLPKVSLRYQLSTHSSLWGRLSRGGRTPQASDLYRLQINQTGGRANVETLDNVELGWLFGGESLRIETVIYHQQKQGFFFRDANGFSEANGKTDHTGIELEIDYAISAQWRWRGQLSYAEHTYAFNREIAAGPNTTETIVSGNYIDTAPKWLASQSIVWTPTSNVDASIRWDLVGSYFTDASNQHEYEGHQLISAQLNFRPTESLELGLSAHNLANVLYADRADYFFGNDRYMPGRPRTVSANLTWAF